MENMETKGFGSSDPIASNSTKAGQSQNRHTEVYILPNSEMIKETEAGTSK